MSSLPFLLLSCSFILHGNSRIRRPALPQTAAAGCGPLERGALPPRPAGLPHLLPFRETTRVCRSHLVLPGGQVSGCVAAPSSEGAMHWVSPGPVIDRENGEGPTLPSVVAASGHPPWGQGSWIPQLCRIFLFTTDMPTVWTFVYHTHIS